jgi:hypothetical protein
MMPPCTETVSSGETQTTCGEPARFKITHRTTRMVIHRCELHVSPFLYGVFYEVTENLP